MNSRIIKILLVFLFGAAFMIGSAFAEDGNGGNKNKQLNKPTGTPIRAFMNINNVSTIIKNTGISDIDVNEAASGLVFPKGSNRTAIYVSGFLWGAFVGDDPQVRVGGSAYREGLQGGAILSDGTWQDPDDPVVRIYRVRPDVYPLGPDVDVSAEADDEGLTEEAVRSQYDLDWSEWPAIYGAPYHDGNGNGMYDPVPNEDPELRDIPGVPGADQTIWYVANDQNAGLTTDLYGAQPLGMEMQATFWAYAQTGALGNMFFRKYTIINKTDLLGDPQNFNEMYVTMWSDPDVGDASEDFMGSDTTLSLVYAYNGQQNDAVYSPLPPPASGFDFFQGPIVESPGDSAIFKGEYRQGFKNLPMTAAYYFTNGDASVTDPTQGSIQGSDQFYNFMNGTIGLTGDPFIDPTTGMPTKFALNGDPQTGVGWTDGILNGPGDRRLGAASGPFTMEPGDTQEVTVAELFAGATPDVSATAAVGLLKFYDQIAQTTFDNFFNLPVPPPAPLVEVTELDREIVLDWSWDVDAINATENFVSEGYAFQGYNVYQLPTAASQVSEGVKIATYDLIDLIKRIDDLVFDPGSGAVIRLPVQLGTDSGIKRYLTLDTDRINEVPLRNGSRYYYAVTSYSYNPEVGKVPSQLENPIKILTAVPQTSGSGVTIGSSTNESLDINHIGTADGIVTSTVIDPTKTTGDDYTISFFEQQQIRNEQGFWVPAAVLTRSGPDTLTGTTIDVAAVYGSDGGNNSTELAFHLDVVHHYYGWVDGVILTFPGNVTVISSPSFEAGGGTVIPEIINFGDSTQIHYGVTDNSATGNGIFHEGGENWNVIVEPLNDILPVTINWVAFDDGYAGGGPPLYGTATVSEIGTAMRTAELWQMRNDGTGVMVLENQSVYTGTDRWPPTDFSPTDLGVNDAQVVEGVQVQVDVGFEAPITFFDIDLIADPTGETTLSSNSSTDQLDIQNYTIFGGVVTSKAIDNFGVGTNELIELQQDYEYRFTGVYEETSPDIFTVTSGGQMATVFRMISGGALADHPLNPSPGTAEPFLLRIPFEVWNVDDPDPANHYQVNLTFRDRQRDGTERPFYSWNPTNRMYAIIVNTPYDENQVIQVDGGPDEFNANATWVTVHYGTNYGLGAVVSIVYANPIVFDVDQYKFTTTAPAYSTELAKSEVDKINVFPNPYYGVNSEELNKYNRFVTFSHLPQYAKIRIFNLAGVLVQTIEKDDDGQYVTWNLANEEGFPVASGLYIAYLELKSFDGVDLGTKILKVAIIQEQQILDRF
jgi:hypothetical protein